MKKKALLLSLLALIFLASCAGNDTTSTPSNTITPTVPSNPTTDTIPTSKDTTPRSDTSTSSSPETTSKPEEPVEITISIDTPSKVELEIGESLTLTATTSGIPQGGAIRWESSDATVISIAAASGKANALKAGTASITASYGEVTSTALTLTVNEPEPEPEPEPMDKKTMVTEVMTKLNAAVTYEKTNAKSGHFYTTNKTKDGVDNGYEKYDFNVYSDNRSVSDYTKKTGGSYSYITNSRYTRSYYDDKLINTSETKNDDGTYGKPYCSISKLTGDDAIAQSQLAYLGRDDNGGFAQKVINDYFSGSVYFAEGSYAENKKIDNFSGTVKDGVYTMQVTSLASNSDSAEKSDLKLILTFDQNALTSVSGTITKYKADYDYDTDKTTYTANGTSSIDGQIDFGTRDATPNTVFSITSLYAQSFDVTFSSGYGSSMVTGTSFDINTSISVKLENTLPTTHNTTVDPVVLSFPENEDKVSISKYGVGFTVTQAIDNLTVKVSTKNVSRTFQLSIHEKQTTKLSYSSSYSSAGVVNEEISGKVDITSGAVTDISYEITSDNKENATLTKKSETEFTLKATKAGTYTVTFTDSKSKMTNTQDFYIVENTDDGLKDLLANSTKTASSSVLKNIAISFDESGKGTLSLTATLTDEYDDTSDVKLSSGFTISNGEFTLDASTASQCISSLAFDKSTHSKIDIGIKDGYSSQTYSVYLKAPKKA